MILHFLFETPRQQEGRSEHTRSIMHETIEALLDVLSWTPLARFIRRHRIQQLNQRTVELRLSKKIDAVFEKILKRPLTCYLEQQIRSK